MHNLHFALIDTLQKSQLRRTLSKTSKKTFERSCADVFYCRHLEITSETFSKMKREWKVTHEMEKKLVVVIDCLCAEHLCPTFEDFSSYIAHFDAAFILLGFWMKVWLLVRLCAAIWTKNFAKKLLLKQSDAIFYGIRTWTCNYLL